MSGTALGLYRAATSLAAPALAAFLLLRRARGKEDGARLAERFGIASRARPAGTVVWLHAASVGEAQSSLALVKRLLAAVPGGSVLVTTGTVSSARLLAERLPAGACHQFVPVDRARWVGRFLDHWRPDLALWIESELWPNLVLETARRRIPMVLVNARMSDRSFAGWRRWPGVIAPLLASFRRVLAQSEADAARYRELGAANVAATGSLKHDAEPLPADEAALAALGLELGGRPRWLAASMHPGEDRAVADAHADLKRRFPALLTILAPRHPPRSDAIARAFRARGLALARRSLGEAVDAATEVYLVDTMGELGLFYRLARIVFMGGSLIPHGGQNLLEPARLGCALLHGPHVENFRPIANALAAAGAAQEVRDGAGLAAAVAALLEDEALCARRGAAAKRASEAGRGVLGNVMRALAPELAPLRARPETSVARA